MLTKSVGYSLPGNVQAGPGSLSEARIVRKGPTKIYDRPVYKEVDVSVDEYGDNALRIFVRINGSLSFDKECKHMWQNSVEKKWMAFMSKYNTIQNTLI